jgi:uncharacterized membrane protein
VRALLSDRRSQFAIGLMLATFAHSVFTLRVVDDSAGGAGHVPGLSVVVAYALMLASIVGLVLYIHQTGQVLRVSGLLDLVGDELRAQIDRGYPDPLPGYALDVEGFTAREQGVVIHFDAGALVEAARREACVLELVPAMGDFVPVGGLLFRVQGDANGLDPDELAGLVALAPERTHEEDPPYGFRKLVDIAERSVSDPFDDPTTTVMAVHRLHDCLRQLATRRFPSGEYTDADGRPRLLTRVTDWSAYVRIAFDEVRLAGSRSPQVARRLRAALEDLKQVAPPERQAPLDRQLALLDSAVRRGFDDEDDVRAALIADTEGIGTGPDLAAK